LLELPQKRFQPAAAWHFPSFAGHFCPPQGAKMTWKGLGARVASGELLDRGLHLIECGLKVAYCWHYLLLIIAPIYALVLLR
jgi:hypothetical protein